MRSVHFKTDCMKGMMLTEYKIIEFVDNGLKLKKKLFSTEEGGCLTILAALPQITTDLNL